MDFKRDSDFVLSRRREGVEKERGEREWKRKEEMEKEREIGGRGESERVRE